jgi:DNA-binding LacI/PurR family transcriptional regulator/biotin operon repressor
MRGDRVLNRAFSKLIDQVVEVLREGILSGRWKETLPGRSRLARELGVSHQTVEEAMRRLVKDGLLVSQGSGRRRRIVLPDGEITRRQLLVRILVYESIDRWSPECINLLDKLSKAGYSVDFTTKSMLDLGMDVKRVARMVQQNPADAWIVVAGSREVLEWFNEQSIPAYAFFGVKAELLIAGCGVRRDIQPLIRRLVELGHRRIVLLLREENLKSPRPLFVRQFFEALEKEGIMPSSYHLPEWGFQPEGLRRCLDSLFKISPPTALIVGEDSMLIAVRDHLARRGALVPRDVSLICLDQNPLFAWCDPMLAHFVWDYDSIIRRILRWVKQISLGREDRYQAVIMAKFIEGESIGPAPKHIARK